MNKIELIDVVVEVVDLIKVEFSCVVDVVVVVIIKVLKDGDVVILVGFGIFQVCDCVVCIGCNLKIGDIIKIVVLKNLLFKVGKVLKDVVN